MKILLTNGNIHYTNRIVFLPHCIEFYSVKAKAITKIPFSDIDEIYPSNSL